MKTNGLRMLGGLVVTASILTVGCVSHETSADALSPKAVRLVSVESAPNAGSTAYSAVIAPNAQVDLAFRLSGTSWRSIARKAPTANRALEPGAAGGEWAGARSRSGDGLSGGCR